MLKGKRGVSFISLAIFSLVFILIVVGIVCAVNGSREYKEELVAKRQRSVVIDKNSYVKVYSKNEIENVARQAYVDNYMQYLDNEVDLDGFSALVIGQMGRAIPSNQLDKYLIIVMDDGIDIVEK